MVIVVVIEIFIFAALLYTAYKLIWYAVKLLILKTKLSRLPDIRWTTSFIDIVFGKKGRVNFVLDKGSRQIKVSVISSISTHSRWNFEKTRNNHYLEVRKRANIFYGLYRNSADVPEHVKMYKREDRFARHLLELPKNESTEDHVLLLYPMPKTVTYTDTSLEYLESGKMLWGYKITSIDDLFII